jgi:hypothetical protein
MLQLTLTLGISLFFIMTIARYILLIKFPRYNKLRFYHLFFWDSQVKGAEAFILMGQLIGSSWVILALIFDKLLSISPNTFRDIIDDAIFYGSIFFWGLIFKSRIQK